MTIKKLKIENIKGIDRKEFELNILPNRPSLLVAPNGFGKSSLACAFSCMQSNRIALDDEHYHCGDGTKNPKLYIEYEDIENDTHIIEADESSNTINSHFDWFVINNQLKAKGVGRPIGGRTSVSASIIIEPVTLIDTIPEDVKFEYSFTDQKRLFGSNGKVLPNISQLFENNKFIGSLSERYDLIDKTFGVRIQRVIDDLKDEINELDGTKAALQDWINTDKIDELEEVAHLKALSDFILEFDDNTGITSKAEAVLAAIQISTLYDNDKPKFKKACKYSNYKLELQQYKKLLSAFNSSWQDITPRKKGTKVVVEFPKAYHIPNGQRDVMSFLMLLLRARKKLRKNNSILIIDEVFDYLDDANLVAVQYYITQFIEDYKREGKRIYPLILTHLNPNYFRNFVFSKQKPYFLDKRDITPNSSFVKLLKKRNNESIKDDVSKYLLHYHTGQINKRNEFHALRLKETWGESDNFDKFVEGELQKYIKDESDYDPLAICCAVRKVIEEKVFDKLSRPGHKTKFLGTNKTKSKLKYAEKKGVEVPEIFYLLGIIYNDGMHWRENQDNISPIAAKLENHTIVNLIKEIV